MAPPTQWGLESRSRNVIERSTKPLIAELNNAFNYTSACGYACLAENAGNID